MRGEQAVLRAADEEQWLVHTLRLCGCYVMRPQAHVQHYCVGQLFLCARVLAHAVATSGTV